MFNSNQHIFLLLVCLFLLLGVSPRSAPMAVSYNRKYIYASVFKVPLSQIKITNVRNGAKFTIPFPAPMQNLSSYSTMLSINSIDFASYDRNLELLHILTKETSSLKLELVSVNFQRARVLEIRYLILSGRYSGVDNPNLYVTNLNIPGWTNTTSQFHEYNFSLPSSLNQTGGIQHNFCYEGFSLLSASNTIKDIGIISSMSKRYENKLSLVFWSTVKTNVTAILLQVAIIVYNTNYYDQEGVGRFHNFSIYGWDTKTQSYVNRSNVFDFSTMVGVTSFSANGSYQFSISFRNPDSFTISSRNMFQHVYVSYILMATFYCSHSIPYYYPPHQLCYDICPENTVKNQAELTCEGDASPLTNNLSTNFQEQGWIVKLENTGN